MYCTTNFTTRKALVEAVKNGAQLGVFSPGPFPCSQNGLVQLEGPHFPRPHKWYAAVIVKDGVIVEVKK